MNFPQSHSFVVRIWWEQDLTRPDGGPLWRGYAQHAASGHSLAFQSLDELLRFIQSHTGDLETMDNESMTNAQIPKVIPPGASPRQVAELHYRSIVEGEHPLWLETLTAENRAIANQKGSSPNFWWQTGRRYATQYGVTYRFQRVDREEPERCKLFFYRLSPDGSQRGSPVPIHLVREEEGWRVEIASY